MDEYDPRFELFRQRMLDEGLPELFIDNFAYYYHQLIAGVTGLISEGEIDPLQSIASMVDLPKRLAGFGQDALRQTAIIKLNGGLGTGMGLQKAKSLLEVKDGYTFLDVIAEQAIYAQVPLVLMNSFATDTDSLAALERHTDLISDVPQSFVQHMEPKVRQSDYLPVDWPQNHDLNWCPPGHGDIYIALVTKGVLAELLRAGYRYAFISNADNLGATLDITLLGYMVEKRLPFMMEVARRTESDRKGGHLAKRRSNGRLVLRELAQCPGDEAEAFQDIDRYRYFNTNNLWIDLQVLDLVMRQHDNNLRLPMIRNSKTVDPLDSSSTPVYQLETAMGSAIEVFDGAEAILVPRSRFAPVKKTDDLLVVRSDVYILTDDYSIQKSPQRQGEIPVVQLDPRWYKFVADFDQRFASGIPSMIKCERLTVSGDFSFGKDVVVQDSVFLRNDSSEQRVVPDGAILTGDLRSPFKAGDLGDV